MSNSVLELMQEIINDLDFEIEKLKPEIFENKYCGRSWERALQKYDELLIKKYQTKQILNAIIERTT